MSQVRLLQKEHPEQPWKRIERPSDMRRRFPSCESPVCADTAQADRRFGVFSPHEPLLSKQQIAGDQEEPDSSHRHAGLFQRRGQPGGRITERRISVSVWSSGPAPEGTVMRRSSAGGFGKRLFPRSFAAGIGTALFTAMAVTHFSPLRCEPHKWN